MIEKAVILSTGDELVSGRVIDTNSSYIAEKLFLLGIEVAAVLKVGDTKERLLWALQQASAVGDLIIGTGGLGPTSDDLTSAVVAEFVGRELKMNEAIAEALKRRFESRGYPWTANNLKQALFPDGADIIPNRLGSAPGFRLSLGNGKIVFWLSGVPKEMEAMLQESVLPWAAQERKAKGEMMAWTCKIYGLTESKLDDILRQVPLSENARLSFRAHYPDLSLRLTVRGENEEKFAQLKSQIGELIDPYVYSEGDETLEQIVGRLLGAKRQSLAVAESCTGGTISHRITRVAGSSAYFKGAAVTYSNESKVHFLRVRESTLERFGAVSKETALEMAEGIRHEADADIGLSVTGIAGPTGGSPEKPVGTVWIGMAAKEQNEARLFRFHGDRESVILGASQAALFWLRTVLLKP